MLFTAHSSDLFLLSINNLYIMKNNNATYNKYGVILLMLATFFLSEAAAQTEVAAWGNITGIRKEGQLFEFETSLQIISSDWRDYKKTGKEMQRPKYKREGLKQLVSTEMDSVFLTEEVSDVDKGKARLIVNWEPRAKRDGKFLIFNIKLPFEYGLESDIVFTDSTGKWITTKISQVKPSKGVLVKSVVVRSGLQTIEISFEKLLRMQLNTETLKGGLAEKVEISFVLSEGEIKDIKGKADISISVNGPVDKSPVAFKLDVTHPGRTFAGLGGNFRLQNPKTDPQVIDYCLENLRVAYGRAEMPWQLWQPDLGVDPIAKADSGKLHPHVKASMEMAQRLSKLGMPLILSAWSGPNWAIVGAPVYRPTPEGVWGNPLNQERITDTYKSITDYILYLKKNYGVEPDLFSFNESDLGINIRQTGAEHAQLIKGLGAYFVSKGLKTKLLLGDNSDANTYKFIYPAMADKETHPYIGAVSFHSWRGWEDVTLQKWADAATKLNKPLLVGEGSIDAAAWAYPAIFEEHNYALEEIALYTKLLSICQPESILQWQLTADYSPLIGGGIFGNTEPLHPGQRFWNLKQLASTPENLPAIGITGNKKSITMAALGDKEKGAYAIHLVNNGSTRQATISGIPANVKALRLFITDKQLNMKEEKQLAVQNGQVKFTMPQTSFVSLISGK